MEIKRGDIYYATLEKTAGSVQYGSRPVLVIQNNKGNHYSPTLIVCAITSRAKSKMPTHVKVDLTVPSLIMTEQILTISKEAITGKLVKSLTSEEMANVNNAIKLSLNI